jgi:hypothetical protein
VTRPIRPPDLRDLVSIPGLVDERPEVVSSVSGVSPSGDPIELGVIGEPRWTLLAFLSTSCDGCRESWRALSQGSGLPGDVRLIVVTRPPDKEDADAVRGLSADRAVVMSDQAWSSYNVWGAPFFVLIDGLREKVAAEGVLMSLPDMETALLTAIAAS